MSLEARSRMSSNYRKHTAANPLQRALIDRFHSRIVAEVLALFGVSVSLQLLLGIMGVPVLAGMLSPVPGGAGVREALMAAAARLVGTAAGPVVLAAVTYRLALFLVTPLVWGAVRLARAGANRQ